MEIIEFNEEEIKKISESLEELDNELIEEIKDNQLKELIKLKMDSHKSSIKLGELYFRIFYILKEINDFTKIKYEDKEIILEEVHNFVKNVKINEDFEYNLKWYKKNTFGSYLAGQKAELYIDMKREEINTLIELFFKLFKGEE